jgi:hypothetical protein
MAPQMNNEQCRNMGNLHDMAHDKETEMERE